MSDTAPIAADQIEAKPSPRCPTCGNPMPYHGGGAGYLCCEWKLLYRADGWLDASGAHVRDERINPSRVQ